MKNELIKQLERYIPYNEQEIVDQSIILEAIKVEKDIFYRTNLTKHVTVSAWVVNSTKDKVLMAYHNIYNSWAWLGGHADGEENVRLVAKKEVTEESGLKKLDFVDDELFSLEILTVDGHTKKGQYIPSHLHYNLTYLIEADDRQALVVKADENSELGWFGLDEAVLVSKEIWFRENIYQKLNQKLKDRV